MNNRTKYARACMHEHLLIIFPTLSSVQYLAFTRHRATTYQHRTASSCCYTNRLFLPPYIIRLKCFIYYYYYYCVVSKMTTIQSSVNWRQPRGEEGTRFRNFKSINSINQFRSVGVRRMCLSLLLLSSRKSLYMKKIK